MMRRRTPQISMDDYLAGLTAPELCDIVAERFFPDCAHPPELIAAAERLLAERDGTGMR